MTLGTFPVTIEHRVAWGEMDAFGHVNNANYLRWFESARIAYFERIGVGTTSADGSAWVPILARATIDFKKPVKYPDAVRVSATVTKLGTTSFVMGYRATSEKLGVVAEGEGVIVVLSPATGAKMELPESLKARIGAVEGGAA